MKFRDILDEMGFDEREAYDLYCKHFGLAQNGASLSSFNDRYEGCFDDEEDFVCNLMDDEGVPDWVQPHVNVKQLANELFNGDYTYLEGHVFHN